MADGNVTINTGDNGLNLEMWPTDKVKPYEKNPRSIPEKAIQKVAASLKEFGFQKPIVVDADVGSSSPEASPSMNLMDAHSLNTQPNDALSIQ